MWIAGEHDDLILRPSQRHRASARGIGRKTVWSTPLELTFRSSPSAASDISICVDFVIVADTRCARCRNTSASTELRRDPRLGLCICTAGHSRHTKRERIHRINGSVLRSVQYEHELDRTGVGESSAPACAMPPRGMRFGSRRRLRNRSPRALRAPLQTSLGGAVRTEGPCRVRPHICHCKHAQFANVMLGDPSLFSRGRSSADRRITAPRTVSRAHSGPRHRAENEYSTRLRLPRMGNEGHCVRG